MKEMHPIFPINLLAFAPCKADASHATREITIINQSMFEDYDFA